MYNIALQREILSAGFTTKTLREALECCLTKLGRGVYSVTARCQIGAHRRLAHHINDEEWTEYHLNTSPDERKADYHYQDRLFRARVLNYPRYRERDVISGVSAAALHEIPMFDISADHPVTVHHPTSNSHTSEVKRHHSLIPPEDTVRMGDLTVASPARAAFDVLGELGKQGRFAALESALRTAIVGKSNTRWLKRGYSEEFDEAGRIKVRLEFAPVADRLVRGSLAAHRMLAVINPRSESLAESYCSTNLHLLGIASGFKQQIKIFDERGYVQRVDFIDENAMVIIEVDGIAKAITGGSAQVSHQSYQHNRLLALGYTVIRFRFADLLSLSEFSKKLYEQAPQLRRGN